MPALKYITRALFGYALAALTACSASPVVEDRDVATDRGSVSDTRFVDLVARDDGGTNGLDADNAGDALDALAPVDVPSAADAGDASRVIVPGSDAWTWVPFPEARCMNGSSTGIGVNFARGSSRLLIVLEGGGACFNAGTCTVGTIHQDGFDETTFRTIIAALGGRGALNRGDSDNPFNNWNYVFVPYCSGDIHAGNNPAGMGGRAFLGYANMGHYLERIVPTFAGSTQVVIAGSSAGGFGAAYNYDRTQIAFGDVPVSLLDDSGPVLPDAYLRPCLQRQLRDAWNLNATLPPDCAACRAGDGGLINMLSYVIHKYPSRRMGLISATYDAVIRTFFSPGYAADCSSNSYFPPADFAAGLNEIRDSAGAGAANFRTYYIFSESHTWLMNEPLGATYSGGVRFTDWLRAFVNGGSGWNHVHP